jgi:hypothetical protein
MPSPQRFNLQLPVQASVSTALPSSQTSPASMVPLPHFASTSRTTTWSLHEAAKKHADNTTALKERITILTLIPIVAS